MVATLYLNQGAKVTKALDIVCLIKYTYGFTLLYFTLL